MVSNKFYIILSKKKKLKICEKIIKKINLYIIHS